MDTIDTIAKRARTACVTAGILLLPLVVHAQVDTSDWKCELCPFEDGYRAEYDAGARYVSDDAAQFGDANGYAEQGGYLNLDGEGRYVDNGMRMEWYAEDLGLDSRVAEVSLGRQGLYDLRLGYRERPQRRFDTTRSIHFASANDTLTLPSGWVRAPQTSGFAALDASLQRQNIESDRRILEFGAAYRPAASFKLFSDYQRQERDGVDIVTGSGFTQASYLARPIDYRTDQVDLGARYDAGALSLTLAYYGSFFRNDIGSLTWDTPFSAVPGAESGRMAVEPDNDFQQLSLHGSYRAAAMDTRVAFSAALGRGEQNDPLLPYTINPGIAAAALPRMSLDGEVDTSNFALTVTSRPVRKLRVKFSYRQDERDNRTPQSQWSRVITDAFLSGANESNLPYGHKRAKLRISGDFRALDTLGISGGYDRTELDRSYQEVAEQTEDSGWGKLRWKPHRTLEIGVRGGAAKRDIDRYDAGVAANFGQNPLMRKYTLAYRYREFGEITVAAAPAGTPVSVAVSMLYADDSYSKSQLGLTDSQEKHVVADLGWALSDRSSLYLSAGSEFIDANQLGSESGSVADWRAVHEDRFGHVGGGFRVDAIADRFDVRLDYTRSDGKTRIDVAGGATIGSRLPDLESTLNSLKLSLNYRWSERVDVAFDLRYESLETADWALDGVLPDTLPTILTLGANAYDYDIWAVGLSFRYRAGAGDIAFPE